MQALTVSFCAMRPTMQTTTNSCIRRVYWHPTQRISLDLKKIGYQVGTGFMVGSPQKSDKWHLAEDLLFLKELNPQMVGIGPFYSPHRYTVRCTKAGTLGLTLFLLGLIRLMLPKYCSGNLPCPLEPLPPTDGNLVFYPGPTWSCQTSPQNRYEAIICSMTIRSVPMQKQPNAGQSWSSVCSPSAIR